MTTLIFDLKPMAMQSVSFGRGQAYQPTKKVAYKRLISNIAKEQFSEELLTNALSIKCQFIFATKNKKLLLKTSRPDLDNLWKPIADALNGIVYVDDSQIVDLHLTKCYSNFNSITISIEELQ